MDMFVLSTYFWYLGFLIELVFERSCDILIHRFSNGLNEIRIPVVLIKNIQIID